MSEAGSTRWWQDTALITALGVALAIWLWDGPIIDQQAEETAPLSVAVPPRTLGEMFDAGCLTQDDLRAMIEGNPISISDSCLVNVSDGPPERRLFP